MSRRVLIAASLAAAAFVLPACEVQRHSFATRATFDDAAGLDADAEVAQAIEGIIARGREIGLRIEARDERRVVLTGVLAQVGRLEAPPAEQRRVIAEGVFSTTPEGDITYRYDIDVVGRPPEEATDAYELGVLRAMLMVREAFETPLDLSAL